MTVRGRANGCAAGGRRCARAPHRLITVSKSRSSVAGSSAALNALFRAKHPIDAGENLQIGPALKTICSEIRGNSNEYGVLRTPCAGVCPLPRQAACDRGRDGNLLDHMMVLYGGARRRSYQFLMSVMPIVRPVLGTLRS